MGLPTRGPWRGVLVAAVAVAVLLGGLTISATGTLSPQSAPAGEDPAIAAAGDIACDPANDSFNNGMGGRSACRQLAVSDLLLDPGIDHVLALGDLQYHCGSKVAFQESYDKSWGRVKDRTLPVAGNHEYIAANDDPAEGGRTGCDAANEGAAGYFDYFGAAAGDRSQGWYSVDVGAWHLVALNSNCKPAGGCGPDSRQVDWLRRDLATHPAACTLAFWHHPRFSSGDHGSDEDYSAWWQVLYEQGVDVVLNGHEHIYERFAKQTPDGTPDAGHGIRQFTVGTGGANLTEITSVLPTSEIREQHTFGVLRMALHPTSYSWEFLPERGDTFTDWGSQDCHGPPP